MMSLPTGTVTFLLTDIEGSTKLWERQPEAMREAVARHDALAAALLVEYNGALVKSRGEGDSLFIVFARATDAIAAACALQRAFAAEPWPTPNPVRVRMALHTGEADQREGDYYGRAINRCARLRAIAHGGQTLLSMSTYELVRDALPEEASLVDAGELSLRDLEHPLHVFQLLHPDLPSNFPKLKSLDALPNNLPRQITTFIGRESEMENVRRLLSTTCLLTITGSGGCGKTRLALQVAADLLEEHPDGVWLIEMATLSDPILVPQAVAAVLDVREEAGRSLTQTLVEYLKPKTLLLLLDNCEHLLSGCTALADALLRACPKLRILATSREGLGIGGETTYRVPSLSMPDPKRLPSLDRLEKYEAIRLFVDRAASAMPSFATTKQNAPALVQVCHHLDGIPLAIELAAARVKSLPVEQIAERLSDRFRLLTGGSRTALPRQQTLRATIDWSYDLLSETERELFHRLAVFVGGFTLEAAEAVCTGVGCRVSGVGENPEQGTGNREQGTVPTPNTQYLTSIEDWEILDLLSQLVDRSLLIAEEQDGRVRYRLLETLRQYAREKLEASGLLETMQKRHLAYFLPFAEEAEKKLRGSEQAWWLERLETEHDNLRAALSRNLTLDEEPETGLRLAVALWWFWHVRGHVTEGRERLGKALSETQGRTSARAKALNGAAVLARDQGDYAAARAFSEESLAMKREMGDRQGIAATLNNLGTLALSQGDYAAARPFYEEGLQIEREVADRQGITASLFGLGNVALEQGDYDLAHSLYEEGHNLKKELGDRRGIATALCCLGSVNYAQMDYATADTLCAESLVIRRQLGDKRGVAVSLHCLGNVAIAQSDYAQAVELLEESLSLRRELGDKLGIAHSLYSLGDLASVQSGYTTARARYGESLGIYRELGHKQGVAQALKAFAYLAVAQERAVKATQLFGAAESLRESIGSPLPPNECADYERNVEAVRSLLGEKRFAATWAEGRALLPEEAANLAMED